MFFKEQETEKYIQAVLRGAHLDKVDNYFYPVGRCAMLHAMWVLHDPFDFLRGMKQKLSVFPEDSLQLMLHYHLKDLHDTEDLQRAVLRVSDVLGHDYYTDMNSLIEQVTDAEMAILLQAKECQKVVGVNYAAHRMETTGTLSASLATQELWE